MSTAPNTSLQGTYCGTEVHLWPQTSLTLAHMNNSNKDALDEVDEDALERKTRL